TPLEHVIVKTGMPGLDLIPSNLTMSTIDLSLMPLAAREFRLRNVLKEVEGLYDFAVLDAPPSFGLLNLNARMAAHDLFVPVLADFLSFHGLKLLFETVQGLEEDLEHVLDHIFIVINAYNATYKIAKEAKDALEKHYPEFLLKQVIRQCTKFAQASSEGIPIFAYDAESKGASDIQGVLDEVQGQIRKQSRAVVEVANLARELTTELKRATEVNARLKVDLDAALNNLRQAADESAEQRAENGRLTAELEKRVSAARDLKSEIELI